MLINYKGVLEIVLNKIKDKYEKKEFRKKVQE
jgi:hypothetical protein